MLDFIYYVRLYRQWLFSRDLWGAEPLQILYGLALLGVAQSERPWDRALQAVSILVPAICCLGTAVWFHFFWDHHIPERIKKYPEHPPALGLTSDNPSWKAAWPAKAGYYQWRKLYACGCCCVDGFAYLTPITWRDDIPSWLEVVRDPSGRWYVVTFNTDNFPHKDHHGDRVIDHWYW